jgi:hypothetical protein
MCLSRYARTTSLELFMGSRLPKVALALATILCGCADFEQSGVVHNLYLIICKPTPEQQGTAQQRVQHYLASVQRGRQPAAKRRYVAIQTLNPTVKQKLTYVTKKTKAGMAAEANGEKLPATWVETEQLHCLMVFDTQSKEFVGSGCYVVGALPAPGTVAQFESVTAEVVGEGITSL